MKLILGLNAYRFPNELCRRCVAENNCISSCLINCSPLCRASFKLHQNTVLWKCLQLFLCGVILALDKSHRLSPDHPSVSQQWRTQHVCLFCLVSSWHQTMIHHSVSDVIKFLAELFWYNTLSSWLYFLNVLGLLEGTRITEKSSGSRNIGTFSSVLHLFARIDVHFQVNNAEQGRIASFHLTNILFLLTISSCIHQQFGRNGLHHLLLDELVSVSKQPSKEFWTWKQGGSLDSVFQCQSLSLFHWEKGPTTRWWLFQCWTCFCSGIPRSFLFLLDQHGFSDKLVNTVHNSNPRFGLIFEQSWTSILCLPCLLQTFMSETGPWRTSLSTTLFIWVPFFDLEATFVLGIKIELLFLLVTEEYRRIVQLRLISNLLRSIVWIPSGVLTISQIVPHVLALGFLVALHWLILRGRRVRIFCFSAALWSTGNSASTTVTAP